MLADAPGLAGRGEPRPQRVEGGRKEVVAPPARRELVVQVEPARLVPQVLVDPRTPDARAVLPEQRLVGQAEEPRDLGAVALHLIQQAVQAHRGVAGDVHAEGPEPGRRIEARLPHRPVALVEERRERVGGAVVEIGHLVVGHLVGAIELPGAVVVRPPLLVALVGDDLRRGAIAEVEVPRQPGVARPVLASEPVAVVRAHGGPDGAQPLAVAGPLEDGEDHPREQRRLRARQVVGPVGVEDGPVVRDLVREVVDEIPGARHLTVLDQAHQDEVAVPSVHLVESSPGDDVGVWQVEQAVVIDPRAIRGQRSNHDLAADRSRKRGVEFGGHAGQFVAGDVERPRLARGPRELGIAHGRRQVTQRPGQCAPRPLDVGAQVGKGGRRRERGGGVGARRDGRRDLEPGDAGQRGDGQREHEKGSEQYTSHSDSLECSRWWPVDGGQAAGRALPSPQSMHECLPGPQPEGGRRGAGRRDGRDSRVVAEDRLAELDRHERRIVSPLA